MLRRLAAATLVCVLAVTYPLTAWAAGVERGQTGAVRAPVVHDVASITTPAPLPASPVAGVLGSATLVGVRDAYSITLNAGDKLIVEMTGAAGTDFDMQLSQGDPNGYLIGSFTWGTSTEAFEWTAWEDAEYLVVLEALSGSGAYTLTWTIEAGAPTDYPPGELLVTSPHKGEFPKTGARAHYYNLDLTAGTILDLAVTFPADLNLDLRLLEPGSAWLDFEYAALADEADAVHQRILYRVPVTGRYTFNVITDYEAAGIYELTWSTASGGSQLVRVSGDDRITTAIAASNRAFPTGAGTVVVATAYNWPDALGGSALAGAYDCPILLTRTDSLPASVATEVTRLGAEHVIVLGGAGAVSEDVFDALAGLDGVQTTERIFGADRYATANAIADHVLQVTGSYTALVATGQAFPDALAASPMAAAFAWPIYLVPPQADRHAALIDAIDAGVGEVLILGGTGVVPLEFETALGERVAVAERLSGANRYATAAAIAEYATSVLYFEWDGVGIATGEDFPDALAGGVMQGAAGAPLLLTTPGALHPATAALLEANKGVVAHGWVLGGTGAVSEVTRLQAQAALELDI